MKIVVAPDAFKECLSASQVAAAIVQGWESVFPDAELLRLPIADGGEGTLQTLICATGGRFLTEWVSDPLGRPIEAKWGLLGDGITAVVEMAEASGLERLRLDERNPAITTSYGTGQLILAALNSGAQKLLIAIGGSATNDAGVGMLSALGAQFFDAQGAPLPAGGLALNRLAKMDLTGLDKRLKQIEIQVACDVTNPLLGAEGASYVFAAQKGASLSLIAELESGLCRFADVVKAQYQIDLTNTLGGGAAGGMGACLRGLLQARLCRGIDLVLDAIDFDQQINNADLVITGEGKIDRQSAHGKVISGVAQRAKSQGIPVIALAGAVGEGVEALHDMGITACFSIQPKAQSLVAALENASANLTEISIQLAQFYALRG